MRQFVWLCAPLLLIFGGATLAIRAREGERRFYSQPFAPQVRLTRGETPVSVPGLFQANAAYDSIGGHGQSLWLVHGRLYDLARKPPREIWNSEKNLAPGEIHAIMSGMGSVSFGTGSVATPSHTVEFQWRFQRDENLTGGLRFVMNAVAVPLPGKTSPATGRVQGISIRGASPAQMAAAQKQPGSRALSRAIDFGSSSTR